MDWRSEDRQKEMRLTQALNGWMKGDPAAVRFCLDIVYIAHLWDDMVDGDRKRTKEEIDYGFKAAMFHLLENPFYIRFMAELQPVMKNAYLCWQASNTINDKAKEWFLKASIYNIIVHCAFLVGGYQWAEEVTPRIWGFYEEVISNA